ncbi:6,7-dimethyl-8-ribityllumazine synthase [Brumimicrobium aurantiacum]|uniref:6,7-dimethyl-8-ribityllumazine synthase n=1 Tax=Brumimicrobium aurantiacum TaxID=1737063 RepID=A0A3E1F0B4_9FLAO|nr:6,7-dimethyl-8-ribityllumazine synthase [Brumimicrobium aurantiacum]RFC55256.1 6,7-dimethyl-8-ribityllumazine synthase [Brumimicrobium aurantiacum]
MATVNKNLSHYDKDSIPNGADFNIGIVVSEWNENITFNLLEGAKSALIENGVKEENIHVHLTPGSFELPLASQWLVEKEKIDGVVAIGSVIQGETKHFDFVCDATAQGVKDVSLKYNKPVIFCVLTDNTLQQAIDRSGGKHGNKGVEAAIACLKMIQLKNTL